MSAFCNRPEERTPAERRAAVHALCGDIDRVLALPAGDPETLRRFAGPAVPVPSELLEWVQATETP